MDTWRSQERARKREYRIKLRQTREDLRAEVAFLERQVARQHDVASPASRDDASPSRHLLAENQCLRTHVAMQRHLVHRLYHWVLSNSRLQHVLVQADGAPWLDSTLLADPTAREMGYRWLTDRVYHLTPTGLPFNGTVDDRMQLNMVRDIDGQAIGMDTVHQSTLLVDCHVVADFMWAGYTRDATSTYLDSSHTDIVFKRSVDAILGTSTLALIRRYDEPRRVVFAMALLKDDECFPLQEGEMRPHGTSWVVLEQVADGVTLLRSRAMYATPLTTHGPLSPTEMAAVFDATPHPSADDVTLARVSTHATRSFQVACDAFVRNVTQTVARPSSETRRN
ncbi:Aste57867_20505 [Aphanomyces stellatus]|uniref:Aste57867_20505 protein n=1 Tax=Aphanomyces stellatus TaxID=120398 RepID=A0A485LF30_9STRA|nr:hypothetical protein As57867_020439 [Aphanomyces stellatus]VFT97190.1 Aste57867_20505 [Aphanomyces stellatus]